MSDQSVRDDEADSKASKNCLNLEPQRNDRVCC